MSRLVLALMLAWFAGPTISSIYGQQEAAPANSSPAKEPPASDAYQIVVVSQSEGLFVMNPDGSQMRQLAPAGMDLLPAWSPDGTSIAFLSLRPADPVAVYDLPFHWFLYRIDAEGGEPKKVSNTPVGMFFQWSPDGKRFVFQSSHEDPRNKGEDGLVSSAIYTMEADGKNLKRLTPVTANSSEPAWTANGKHITFTSRRDGSDEAYIMNADGSDLKPLSEDVGHGQRSDRPPAKRLVSLNGEVYLVSDGEQKQTRLTTKEDQAMDYALSPDGKAVFFRSKVGDGWGLFRVDASGKNRQRLAEKLGSITGFDLSPLLINKDI